MIRHILFAIAASLTPLGVLAAAPESRYVVDIDDFIQLKVSSGINVNYVCNPDSAGKAMFYATPELASVISFSNNKKKLTVAFTTKGVKYGNVPTVTVYSNFLTLAENRADSLLKIVSVAPGPELKLRLMGSGRIVASGINVNDFSASITTGNGSIVANGKCVVANLTSLSTGTIQADNLESEIVKCKLIGTGEIGCWPKKDLMVKGGGSGKVLYRGTPEMIEDKAANIKVEAMKAE